MEKNKKYLQGLIMLKSKTKKYQYLYLREKISAKDYYNEINYCEFLNKRIEFYSNWLSKINRRYNYV